MKYHLPSEKSDIAPPLCSHGINILSRAVVKFWNIFHSFSGEIVVSRCRPFPFYYVEEGKGLAHCHRASRSGLHPGLVSQRRPLPREKGSGDISIANLFCWNADMSLRAQKLRSSQGNCNDMCGQYTAHVRNCSAVFFFMAAVLCIACWADTGPKSRVNFSAG